MENYTAQFPLRLMRKDFELILSKAVELDVPMPATQAASEMTAAEAYRGDEEDSSAVIRLMEQFAGENLSHPPAA